MNGIGKEFENMSEMNSMMEKEEHWLEDGCLMMSSINGKKEYRKMRIYGVNERTLKEW